MRLWMQKGMPEKLKINYSEIARILGLSPKNSVGQIKQALRRLILVEYELVKCFIVAGTNKRITTFIKLYESGAQLFETQKGKSNHNYETELTFPPLIKDNLEKYYQLLDMAWYRALPAGLSRRLYEYLEKRRYHCVDNVFKISEDVLCRWLPLKDDNKSQRRRTLRNITKPLQEKGFLENPGFEFDKKNLCLFYYAPKSIPKEEDDNKNKIKKRSNQEIYFEFVEWLGTIDYFKKDYKEQISLIPMPEIIERYPGIRSEYEKLQNEGKSPKPVWVYQALMGNQTIVNKRKKEIRIKNN